MKPRLNRLQMAHAVAQDIPEGSYVNLGIGIPSLIADCVPQSVEIVFQTENGVLGVGPKPPAEAADWEQINASKEPVTVRAGGSFFSHVDAFGMIRGGHIDVAVLGAFQVSGDGDIANWTLGEDDVPAVGGAMDLAVGARNVYAVLTHVTREGAPKIVQSCAYPLTARAAVTRVYTDLCVLAVTGQGYLRVEKMLKGWTFEELQAVTGAAIRPADNMAWLDAQGFGNGQEVG